MCAHLPPSTGKREALLEQEEPQWVFDMDVGAGSGNSSTNQSSGPPPVFCLCECQQWTPSPRTDVVPGLRWFHLPAPSRVLPWTATGLAPMWSCTNRASVGWSGCSAQAGCVRGQPQETHRELAESWTVSICCFCLLSGKHRHFCFTESYYCFSQASQCQ